MHLFHAALLGLVEGVTEFLPISSTAHLILVSRLLGIPQTEFQKLFEVVIQSGAILAVIFLYGKKLLDRSLLERLVFSFIPTAVVGYALHGVIKNIFFEMYGLMYASLVFVGIAFILVGDKGKSSEQGKKLKNMPLWHAVIAGLVQAAAVVPGVSRAGAVILGLIGLGYSRTDAARYSFMLALPTIVAASVLDVVKTPGSVGLISTHFAEVVIGITTSFVVAYVSMRLFINFLERKSLAFFGYYRIAVGIMGIAFIGL